MRYIEKDTANFIQQIPRSILFKGYIALILCLLMMIMVISVIPQNEQYSFSVNLKKAMILNECVICVDGLPHNFNNLQNISRIELEVPLTKCKNDRLYLSLSKRDSSFYCNEDNNKIFITGNRANVLGYMMSHDIVSTHDVKAFLFINHRAILDLFFSDDEQRKEKQNSY